MCREAERLVDGTGTREGTSQIVPNLRRDVANRDGLASL